MKESWENYLFSTAPNVMMQTIISLQRKGFQFVLKFSPAAHMQWFLGLNHAELILSKRFRTA